jgi:hypothetical protein
MKQQGWEERLLKTLESSVSVEYRLGVHDCFTVACAAVNVQLGTEHGKDIVSKYSTRDEAVALLGAWGATYEEAFDKYFGLARVPVLLARRGDLLAVRTDDGEKHLAVCVGERMACLGPDGLRYAPVSAAHCAWRVG